MIMELLPRKDGCCNCGHCTCEVYALELVSGRVTVDACPSITNEVRRLLSEVLRVEERAAAAFARVVAPAWTKPVLLFPARVAGLLLALFPVVAALSLFAVWALMQ